MLILGTTTDKIQVILSSAITMNQSVIVPILAAASTGSVNLILSPTGTGGIQTQVADNTATGGQC